MFESIKWKFTFGFILLYYSGAAASVLEDFWSSRALKKLVLKGCGSDKQASEARKIAAKLWKAALKGRCSQLARSHAAKVIHCPGCSVL